MRLASKMAFQTQENAFETLFGAKASGRWMAQSAFAAPVSAAKVSVMTGVGMSAR
jgi:hypothetical protein